MKARRVSGLLEIGNCQLMGRSTVFNDVSVQPGYRLLGLKQLEPFLLHTLIELVVRRNSNYLSAKLMSL